MTSYWDTKQVDNDEYLTDITNASLYAGMNIQYSFSCHYLIDSDETWHRNCWVEKNK